MRTLVVTNMYPTAKVPDDGTFIEAQVESLRELGVHVDVLHVSRIVEGRGIYWHFARTVKEAVAEHEPDLVHVAYGGVPAYLVTRAIRDRPVLVTYHGSDLLGFKNNAPPLDSLSLRVGVLASWRAARRAAGIIVVAAHLYDALPASLDYARVWIVPNGVDMSRFQPLDRRECQLRLGWDPARRHVIFAAQPARPEKRFALAKEAVALLHRRDVDVELHALEGIPNPEVPTWLNASHAMLLTSTHEGSPVVVKEALACNVSVVSVDVGDIRERIAGIDGCYIAKSTPQDLADSLERALGREERINARERVTDLSLESVAARINEIYSFLISGDTLDAPSCA